MKKWPSSNHDRWQDRCTTTLLPKHRFENVKLDGWWGDEGSSGRSDLDERLKQLAIFEFGTTICDTWKVNKICIPPRYFICLNKYIRRVWTNRSHFTNDFERFSTGKRSSSFVKNTVWISLPSWTIGRAMAPPALPLATAMTLSVAKHLAQNQITLSSMLELDGCDWKWLNLTNVVFVQLMAKMASCCAQW